MVNEWIVKTEKDILEIKEQIWDHIKSSSGVVLLEGDMGAGKTTMVKSILKGKVKDGEVCSPTYSLVNEYIIQSELWQKVYHMDLYRIEHVSELESIDLPHYFEEGALCFIEWPGIAETYIPDKCLRIQIEVLPTGQRKIVIL